MEVVDLRCPACGYKIKGPENIKSRPQKLLELCPSCSKWNRGLLLLAIIVTVTIIVFTINMVFSNFSFGILIGVFGLILDVWGGFLIATGYTEKIYAEVGALKDRNADLLYPHLPKQTKRIRFGLILLILGFLGQALSSLI